ncbi:MAG: hypothetical protein IIW76_02765 [Bacteroidales bacterium]|nr:hypothetical protein [Bacteroidales bacterium]
MKKLIVTIICVLFASTSFAQMVGASSIAKQSAPKTTLGVKKHEFSIHGGFGVGDGIEDPYLSGIIKYKFKPSDKYNIRLLGEVGANIAFEENLSYSPILVGLNYEKRFNNNWSIFADLGFGLNIPLDSDLTHYDRWSDYYEYSNFEIGWAFSPEIGFSYKNFMFSGKFLMSTNICQFYYYSNYYGDEIFDSECLYQSFYFLFTLGYRF